LLQNTGNRGISEMEQRLQILEQQNGLLLEAISNLSRQNLNVNVNRSEVSLTEQ
jgi:hypothetical protein